MGRFIFDAPEEMLKLCASHNKRSQARSMYVTWVNNVLKQLHECPCIQVFRVKFDLDVTAREDIVKWIKFLTPKRVKVLDINFDNFWILNACTLTRECGRYLRSFKFLRSISLYGLIISKKLLNYFLCECSHLETFSIAFASRPIKFEVKVTSPSIRHLGMFLCRELTAIELAAPKLKTFTFTGQEMTEFRFGNNPCLTNISLADEKQMHALVPISKHLPQIKILQINTFVENKGMKEIPQILHLRNLKHLIFNVYVSGDTSILGITTLIAAAPFLVKFTLQFQCSMPSFIRSPVVCPAEQIHRNLKVVKLLGFIGCFSDFELASFLIKIAINLKRMVIDPYRRNPADPIAKDIDVMMETESIRQRASERLKDSFPPSGKLIIY